MSYLLIGIGIKQLGYFMLKKILNSKFYLYFFALLGAALLFLLLVLSPVQLPVVLYKITLVAIAAIFGLFFDFIAFPYARPTSYLCREWHKQAEKHIDDDADYPIAKEYKTVFSYAMLRRTIIIGAFILAVALGL